MKTQKLFSITCFILSLILIITASIIDKDYFTFIITFATLFAILGLVFSKK